MVKKRTTTHPEQLFDLSTLRRPLSAQRHSAESPEGEDRSSLRQPVKRYGSLALTLAVVSGGLLMLSGHVSLGKGLILGALFSIVNFVLMAVALPLRIGRGRGPSALVSLASIAVRYALLAAPLIFAFNHLQFAVSSTAAGLFMVQLSILLEQAWAGRQNIVGTEE